MMCPVPLHVGHLHDCILFLIMTVLVDKGMRGEALVYSCGHLTDCVVFTRLGAAGNRHYHGDIFAMLLS